MEAKALIDFIDSNLSSVREARDVAIALGVNYETFRKGLRRATGQSPAKLIRRRRVAVMQELLAGTDLRCFEVCYRVGFTREETGGRVFKRLAGLTMTEYRQQTVDGRRLNAEAPLFDRKSPAGVQATR